MNDYDLETEEYLAHGIKLFVGQMFGPDERSHMEAYCNIFQPSGTIIDMGGGIGETGAWIKTFNPSSRTISITNSKVQAEHMRDLGREYLLTDFHETEIPDEFADCVMFNESFGYGDPERLMQEAARVLKVDGYVLIKDFTPIENINKSIEFSGWGYFIHPVSKIISSAENANLKLVWAFNKEASSDRSAQFFSASKMKQWHKNISFPAISTCLKFSKLSHVQAGSVQ